MTLTVIPAASYFFEQRLVRPRLFAVVRVGEQDDVLGRLFGFEHFVPRGDERLVDEDTAPHAHDAADLAVIAS